MRLIIPPERNYSQLYDFVSRIEGVLEQVDELAAAEDLLSGNNNLLTPEPLNDRANMFRMMRLISTSPLRRYLARAEKLDESRHDETSQ